MTVLGILFEAKLTWGGQVHKSIKKGNQSLQGLKQILCYFNEEEKTKTCYCILLFKAVLW